MIFAHDDEDAARERLILAYCPAVARPLWAGLFALNGELARQAARPAAEPIFLQMRLAWWRDALAGDEASADPVLATLAPWGESKPILALLVDAWEAIALEASTAPSLFAEAMAMAAGVIAERAGANADGATLSRLAANWASGLLRSPDGDFRDARLPRCLVPLRQISVLARLRHSSRPGGNWAIIRLGFNSLIGQ